MIAFNVQSYPLNNNEWSFPVCECIHIIGFAFSIGTVALVDLRLLGLGMQATSSKLLKNTAPWTLWGLVGVITTGFLIFFSDPAMYLHNQSFRFKITALLLAILFNYTIHRKAALEDASGGWGRLVGVVSLALWLSVVAGGLFIAFV
jgi:hypothetical protein